MAETSKTCSKCKRELPATNQYYQNRLCTKDGFHYSCKECNNGSFKPIDVKTCGRCKKEFPKTHDYFYYRKKGSTVLKSTCRICEREIQIIKRDKGRVERQEKESLIDRSARTCVDCGETKPATEEHFYKRREGLLRRECKECQKEKTIKNRAENPEKVHASDKKWYDKNAETKKVYNKTFYWNNLELCRNRNKEQSIKHSEKRKISGKLYRIKNADKIRISKRIRQREKRANDPKFNINFRMRDGIRKSLCGGKNGRRWEELVGYTVADLMNHLESLFLPGMSWESRNFHIDHIRPLSSFNFTTYEDKEFKEAWSLKNLQPLFPIQNLNKHAKWNPKQLDKHGNLQTTLIL